MKKLWNQSGWLGTLTLALACVSGLALPAEAGCGSCGPKEGVEAEPEHEHATLTTGALRALLDAKAPVVVLDARGTKGKGRVPGAHPISHNPSESDVAQLVPSKTSLVVTYCGGPKCTLSSKLAHRLSSLGYANVMEYPEGISGWTACSSVPASSCSGCTSCSKCSSCEGTKKTALKAELNTTALQALVAGRVPFVLLDARTGKYDDGRRIAHAKKLGLQSTPAEIAAAVPNKKSLVVTYCGGLKCSLSSKLAKRLKTLGYENVVEFPAGIAGWAKAGNSVSASSTRSK